MTAVIHTRKNTTIPETERMSENTANSLQYKNIESSDHRKVAHTKSFRNIKMQPKYRDTRTEHMLTK